MLAHALNHSSPSIVLLRVAAAAQAPQPWTRQEFSRFSSPPSAGSSGAQLSVSKKGVLVSWLESDDDEPTLKFAERTAAGWTQRRQGRIR